ncbi:MAG: hypothetical protein IPL03_08965 [Sterolibacteriaceae bacterium]|nr:hypothetical protein [Candidatus Methylophosphatis haderslevensis]
MASPTRLHRLNYFDGRLLTAEDFRDEQAYLLGRARRHNRHVHGWGVISGLDVRVTGNFVEVSPGAAIDCAGNELVVENGVALSMPPQARAGWSRCCATSSTAPIRCQRCRPIRLPAKARNSRASRKAASCISTLFSSSTCIRRCCPVRPAAARRTRCRSRWCSGSAPCGASSRCRDARPDAPQGRSLDPGAGSKV